jgi:hypothetical protein
MSIKRMQSDLQTDSRFSLGSLLGRDSPLIKRG